MTPQEHLAKILRTKPKIIIDMEEKMEKITGKKNVVEKIMEENKKRIDMALQVFNIPDHSSKQLYKAIINKLKRNDEAIYKLFKKPDGVTKKGLQTLFEYALQIANPKPLFVLKEKIARRILEKNPPIHILKALNYKNIKELLEKEDFYQVFSALRFVESTKWMHKTFDKSYKNLKPSDFENRKVKLLVLDEKWLKVAEKFIKKKYHNISHLKELGVLFVIPLKIDTAGETMRMFSLILHYLHELEFYRGLIKNYAKRSLEGKDNFGEKLCSLLRGDVPKTIPHAKKGMNWMIVQRYLAKGNKNDPRLFIPHVNPEAVHWKKAEHNIAELGRKFKELDIDFWEDLDWVGDFFDKNLVSFDLIDAVMSLVKNKDQVKYLYHHQEALWNRIFEEYMGDKNLEKLLIENFDKEYISLPD